MAASFSFPTRSLYGISIDVNAPFTPRLQARDRSESPGSLGTSLIGTWELITYYAPAITDSTDIFYPLSKEAKGILMYNPDGYMSACLLRPGQQPYTAAEPGSASPAELAESTKRYLGYAGPFYLDESGDRPTVRHLMKVVNFPNWIGNIQTRVVELENDRLTLGLESVVDMAGVRRNPLLVWTRVPKNNVRGSPSQGVRQRTGSNSP